ncbi:MAG: hypothetical protein NWQ42_11380 [Alishewanella sp.]|nr:hypothetical protein [Alishewanella sp.]
MSKFLSLIFICLTFQSIASEAQPSKQQNDERIQMMIVAKATGMCDALSQIITFQQTHKMPGSDQFVIRFLNDEAARLNKSLDDYMAQCAAVSEQYHRYMNELGFH